MCLVSLLASSLGSPLLNILGPLGSILQDMPEMPEMPEMPGAETMMPMEGMATAMAPAMTMSFLLPGIGLGLLKGMLLGT